MINLSGEPLTQADLANLEASFITSELAEAAGLRRVDSSTGAALVGQNGNSNYSGIVFPYFFPSEVRPREYRIRRDNPDYERKNDGTVKVVKKYVSPPGRGNLLYFVPGTTSEQLQDVSLPVAITEGEKKALALFRLASWQRIEGEQPRFLSTAVAGAWNWLSRNVGKTEDENGKRIDLKGVIPDLDRINWKGRVVFIAYDTNVAINPSVSAARRGLALELKQRGAIVRYINLPVGLGLNGVDDILAAKGAEYVLDLIDNATDAADVADSFKAKRPSQASELLSIAENLQLFRSDDEGFASVKVNGHREHLPLKSRAFRRWLSQQFYERKEGVPNAQALQDAIEALQGKALFASEEKPTYLRVAQHNGNIYLDLGNADWQAVEISADGWRVVDNPPVIFLRTRGMKPLPLPEAGGSLDELRPFINIGSDENFALIKGFLAQSLRFNTPFPVLILHGEQGCAKSTTAKVLRNLIDPNVALLGSEPREERDLIAAVRNSWMVALDNLSRVPIWLSDNLCRISTGGGFRARELFTNGDEVLIDAMRPVILTGIEDVATKGDLLDRALILYLPNISEEQRREESEFWADFERMRPRLLGGLCNAVSKALRLRDHTTLKRKPRMADFAVWAVAAEGAAEETSLFLKAYRAMRASGNELALEASPVASLIRQFIDREKSWLGSATSLLEELNNLADEQTRKLRTYPANGRSLSGNLRRLAPDLRATGIDAQFNVPLDRTSKRGIQIEQVGNFASSASAPSASEVESHNVNGLPADASADVKPDADATETETIDFASAQKMMNGNGLRFIKVAADGADANFGNNSTSKEARKVRVKL